MKMMMRPDKTQHASLLKYTAGQGAIFNRDKAMMFGYKTYDVMCVGGAGGLAGNTSTVDGMAQYAAAGGGGGSIRRRAALSSLTPTVALLAGSKGANSASSPGNGADGTTSSFGLLAAYGGKGAIGGEVVNDARLGRYSTPSMGGDGGGNSDNRGVVGSGGFANSQTRLGATVPGSNATNGTYVDAGAGNGGGCGGGGGRGRYSDTKTTADSAPGPGGIGSNLAGYWCNPGAVPANSGGYGGGADISSITGSSEVYGVGTGGVVALKLS